MDKVVQVIKDLFGWFFGTCFVLLALGLFFGGTVFGGVASLLFGLGITPLRRKLMWPAKVSFIVLSCLFLISCGSLAFIGSTEQTEEKPQQGTQEQSQQQTIIMEDSIGAEEVEAEEPEPIIEPKDPDEEEPVSEMQVHFIDVGQGDATLVLSGKHAMLIDTGDNSKGTKVQLYLKNQGVEKLDYLVLTHTDADHIGGADVIISKFPVDNVFIGDFPKESDVYRDLLQALKDKGLSYTTPEVGDTYALGDAFFMIAAPNRIYSDPNNSSIALVLQNGVNRFLFTGDAEEKAEADILANGLNINCDVFKVGHHGSNMSNTYALLAAVSPLYAVISCEADNSYGHPHAEVLNNLRAMDVKVFRTDEQGSVMATSDGMEIAWNCAPSDSWKAGERTQNSENASGEETEQEEETEPEPEQSTATGNYAVNSKNGKIHIVGSCPATGTGDGAMTSPVYFDTYEEAEAYSMQLESDPDKRKCKNCYK
ncbi:MAG: MBL fold metallo-hydrolase [Lachnospiraceae bacterium]|nr:MBL fold metallo-hydrolase [Lachnospiraceae bacterium]